MKTQSLLHKLAINTILPLALSLTAQAQTIMVNFDAAGFNLTAPDNAPYVADGGNTGLWQLASPSTVSTNLDLGSGVELTFGIGTVWNTINFTTFASDILRPLNLGSVYNTGIYAAGGPGRGGILPASTYSATSDVSLGLQISGLAVGEYAIYLSGINTNSTSSLADISTTFYLSTNTAKGADSVNYSDFTSAIQKNTAGDSTDWVENQSYVQFTVTISSAEDILTLVSKGTSGDSRGLLNSLQIIQIPEPSTWFLLVGGGGVLLPLIIMRRRQQPQA
jgi:hypothetical protein